MLKIDQIGKSVFNIWQPCLSEKIENVSIRFLIHANVSLATKIMFRIKVNHKIDQKCLKTAKMVKNGKSVYKIWQPCLSEKFENASILFLVHENVSLATKVMSKTKDSHKIKKKCLKTAENAKNRRIQLKYRAYGFGNTFIRILYLENIYFGTNIFVLR